MQLIDFVASGLLEFSSFISCGSSVPLTYTLAVSALAFCKTTMSELSQTLILLTLSAAFSSLPVKLVALYKVLSSLMAQKNLSLQAKSTKYIESSPPVFVNELGSTGKSERSNGNFVSPSLTL